MDNPGIVTALIGLGTNMGHRESYLLRACEALDQISKVPILTSPIYNTPPMGPAPQDDYLNMCLKISTHLTAQQLLRFCKETEQNLGRIHRHKWGPREIDIDILCFGEQILSEPHLQIPHPGLPIRQFVLKPLCDIAPNFKVPGSHCTIQSLFDKCIEMQGPDPITLYSSDILQYATP